MTATDGDGFESLGIGEDVMRAVREVGYELPTPIQRQTIPILMSGNDLMAQSQTGTGKTAAFAIPLIEHIDTATHDVQAIILAPTRELAVQVAETVHKLGKYRHISDLPIYGGQPIDRQLRALRRGVQVVVGTPGRIMDHMRRGTLDLSHVSMVVLDEADQMLDMGFIEDIEFILDDVPEGRQIALFSATLPPRIQSLAKRYMHDPSLITVAREKLTVPEVKQLYVETTRDAKVRDLTRILDMEMPESSIVFVRTKQEADNLRESLMGQGYGAEVIHGDLSQQQRERALAAFRDGRADVLVATDVAARGLDIPNVSHVFNFDIPGDPEAYVHRIGRTARAGQAGTAVTFVTPRERGLLRTIERLIGIRLDRKRVPSLTDIAERRARAYRDSLCEAIEAGGLEPFMVIVEELGSRFDIAEIAAGAIKLSLNENLVPTAEDDTPREAGMERLFIGAGRRDNVSARDLVGAIANEARISGREIGAIDLYDNFSFVEVPGQHAQRVVDALNRSGVRGRHVRVDIAVPGTGAEQERPRRPRPARR